MGFGWDTTREPCDDAVRAVVGQLRIALREVRATQLAATSAGADAAVHEARKALRRARALGELLRPLAGGDPSRDLIDAVRGARRRLSAARDGAVLSAALRAAWRDRVAPGGGGDGRPPDAAVVPLRNLFEADGRRAQAPIEPETVAAIAAALEGARHDARLLHAAARAAGDDLETLGRGLRRLHRRARAAAAATSEGARDDAGSAHEAAGSAHDDALHDARKRFKELGYVMRWWAPAWRRPVEAWLDEVDALGDLIGADHDQVVLRSRLPALAGAVDGELLAHVFAGSEQRSARLRAKAARALVRLAAEPSGAFVARHLAYMAAARAWRLRRGSA